MTAVITSTNTGVTNLQSTRAAHLFRMSDGKRVAIWLDSSTKSVMRSTSTDGVTWTATAAIFTSSATGLFIAAAANGDTIYGVINVNANVSTSGTAWKMAYAAGAFTDTSATFALATPPQGNVSSADARWDSVKSVLHVAFMANDGTNARTWLIAISTALGKVAEFTLAQGNSTGSPIALAVDGAATPNVYVLLTVTSTGATSLQPLTFSGTAYTAGAIESPSTLVAADCALALDQSANLDLFIVEVLTGALKTLKRTGVNTYSAITTLVASAVDTSVTGDELTVARTGNANADLIVLYRYNGGQTNGEIYYIKRTAGTWGTATRLAGGANTGWQTPSGSDLIQGDGIAHLGYLTGTSTFALTYDGSLLSGTAPSAPINVLPTGTANSSLTPPCSSTYKNTQVGDGLGKYRILVTRQSDGVVFWDTGAAGTAYTGAAITDGGTFSLTYAGTALVKGTIYLIAMNFWDALASLAGPLSTAVAFTVNDAPTVTITGPTPYAAEPSSGLAVTFTFSQTLAHAQSSFRVRVLNAGGTTVIYDSGTQSGAATSWTVPTGTLANSTAFILEVTATSSDGL